MNLVIENGCRLSRQSETLRSGIPPQGKGEVSRIFKSRDGFGLKLHPQYDPRSGSRSEKSGSRSENIGLPPTTALFMRFA